MIGLVPVCGLMAGLALAAGPTLAQPPAARRAPAPPRAPADEELGATARVDRPLPGGTDEDPTASATVIDAQERPRALERTDELLLEVPGAHVVRLGAPGAPASLSLRGADPDQTTVLFDDVPLDPVRGGAFDLSTVPASLLRAVEVHRGGAPLFLDAGAIGGVLRLLPREDAPASLTLGAGSFGHLELDAVASAGADGGPRFLGAAGASRSDGDFRFVHPGASLDPSDDRELVRRNGSLEEARGLATLSVPAAGGRLRVLASGFGRVGGEPGLAARPAAFASRSHARGLIAAAFLREAAPRASLGGLPPARASLTASAAAERHRFTDLWAETGIGRRATDDRTSRFVGRAAVDLELSRLFGAGAVLSVRRERFDPEDAFAARSPAASARTALGAGLEARLRPRLLGLRAQVRASGRLELALASLSDTRPEGAPAPRASTLLLPSGRVAATLELARGVAAGLSASAGVRAPSLLELFGDRAFLLGSASLRPERSLSADASLVARGRAGALRGAAELRGFALFAEDLVRYRANAQGQAVPENVDAARVLGGELGARGVLGRHLALAAAATIMLPQDRSAAARDLPLRPRLVAHARPELRLGGAGPLERVVVFVEGTHVARSFVDPTNVAALEARTHLGAGVSVELLEGHAAVAVLGRDLLDARGEDVLGFPLPGRSIALTLTLRPEGGP